MFDLTERWTRVCERLVELGRLPATAPVWYYGGSWNLDTFNYQLGDFSNSVAGSVAPPPSIGSDTGFGSSGSAFGGGGFGGGGSPAAVAAVAAAAAGSAPTAGRVRTAGAGYFTPTRSQTKIRVSPGPIDAARAAVAVGEVRRDDEPAASADLHADQAVVPAGDDPTGAQREDQRLAAVVAGVELLTGGEGDADVVHGDASCRGRPRGRCPPRGR